MKLIVNKRKKSKKYKNSSKSVVKYFSLLIHKIYFDANYETLIVLSPY